LPDVQDQQPDSAADHFGSFQEAVGFLEGMVNYEKRTRWKYTDASFDLRRTRDLLAQMGNPHDALRIVHVAGTKGKGTTSALVASMLQAGGLRAGLHTSPHLVSVCERMRVDGTPIPEGQFQQLLGEVRDYVHRKRTESRNDAPTYFELTAALAMLHFRRQNVDWAVIEVGLGGRLDSTNVVSPRCAVITPIGFDHMDKLGDTLAKIAGEKAGILKPGVPLVLAAQRYPEALRALRQAAERQGCPRWEVGREVVISGARALAAPLSEPDAPVGWAFDVAAPSRRYEGLNIGLLGAHQVENCATAIGAVEILRQAGELELEPDAVRTGAAHCRWPARVELLARAPALILDAAHTVESVQALVEALATHFPSRAVSFVFGCSADKNAERMLTLMAPNCVRLVATRSESPRAVPAGEIARLAAGAGIARVDCVESGPQAVARALGEAGPDEVVCVTGSFFLAGEVREAWELGSLTGC